MRPDEFLGLLHEALDLQGKALTLDTEIKSVDEWDSLGWLSLLTLIDERLGIQLSVFEVVDCLTARQVYEAINAKLSA